MNPKVGDIVRYLNAVGGGRVVRIVDNMAIVDDDGFETPVLLRECVVVTPAAPASAPRRVVTEQGAAPSAPRIQQPKAADEPTRLPVVETADGDVLNVVLAFEPTDIRALSRSSFDAFVVNDSNYYIYVTIASRTDDSADGSVRLRYAGVIEPNIQEFVFELPQADLPSLNGFDVQLLAYKADKPYAVKTPAAVAVKVDKTKFAKLHCFRPNPYFDEPVIAYDIVVADRPASPHPAIAAADIEQAMRQKSARPKPAKHPVQHRHRDDEPIVVDLHASELLDDVRGLSNADILNLQIDRFTDVMNQNLRKVGRKIIFIHGKGEGVLRQAIMKELTHRFKGHDVQDASFREYGFGATQVTIKNVGR